MFDINKNNRWVKKKINKKIKKQKGAKKTRGGGIYRLLY